MAAYTEIPVRYLRCRAGDPLFLMARILATSGLPLTNAMMAGGTMKWSAFDYRGTVRTAFLGPTALTISSVLFDTYVANDVRWDEDEIGYNFGALMPQSITTLSIPGAGHRRVEIQATPAAGGSFWIGAWDLTIAEMLTLG
jgi:hypothetical protein